MRLMLQEKNESASAAAEADLYGNSGGAVPVFYTIPDAGHAAFTGRPLPGKDSGKIPDQTIPCASMALTTFRKPAMLAPAT